MLPFITGQAKEEMIEKAENFRDMLVDNGQCCIVQKNNRLVFLEGPPDGFSIYGKTTIAKSDSDQDVRDKVFDMIDCIEEE